MSKLTFAALAVAAFASAAAAAGSSGQCYDAAGRPVGPAFDPARADRAWIESVRAQGGTCNAPGESRADATPRFTEHETPNHRHLLRHRPLEAGE